MKHSGKSINSFIFYIRILYTSTPSKYLLYLPEKLDWFPSLCNNLKYCMKYSFLGWRLMRTFYRKTYIKISWKTLVNRECLIDTNGCYYHDIILARSPDDPRRIGVASVFEPFAWLFLVCLSACQQIFSFFFSSPPLL